MKNIKRLFLLIVITLLFTSCGKNNNLKSLSYSEFNKKLEKSDTFFVVIIKDGCQHCESYIPKVKEVVKEYDIVGYTLNFSSLSESEDEEFYNKYQVDSTPTTLFFKDGNEVSLLQRIVGNVSKDKLVTKLKNNGYIK